MEIQILESKVDQLMGLIGIGRPKITQEQKDVIAEYLGQVVDPLIDAFWDAQIPEQFSVVIEDVAEGVKFKLTLKKL